MKSQILTMSKMQKLREELLAEIEKYKTYSVKFELELYQNDKYEFAAMATPCRLDNHDAMRETLEENIKSLEKIIQHEDYQNLKQMHVAFTVPHIKRNNPDPKMKVEYTKA